MRTTSMYLFVIFSISIALTLLFVPTGWEAFLVNALYNPQDTFSWWLREYGKYPAIGVSIFAVVLMLIPYLRNQSSLLRRIAATWLIALIFGAGLIGGWVTVEGFDRPRPRATELLGGQEIYTPPFIVSQAEKGKSFTSGHAAMGFIFAAPFFALRRKHPKIAYGFLTSGLVFGGVLGYTRMVLGAHFITDVIWACAFVLAAAAIGNALWKDSSVIKSRYILSFLVITVIGIAWFNKFETTLTFTGTPTGHVQLATSCNALHLNSEQDFTVEATIRGYGAPKKLLRLVNDRNILILQQPGLFRDTYCEHATITVPATKTIAISKNQPIEMGENPLLLVQTTNTHRIFSGEIEKND